MVYLSSVIHEYIVYDTSLAANPPTNWLNFHDWPNPGKEYMNKKRRKRLIDISRESNFSNYTRSGYVQPIRTHRDRMKFKHYWLTVCGTRQGRKNWTLFMLGIVTALRASDLIRLQFYQVYRKDNRPRTHVIDEIDQKTNKINNYLYIGQLSKLLVTYYQWRKNRGIYSKWMFPRYGDQNKHVSGNYIYMILSQTGDKLHIHHLGSHSLRKTFGYLAYKQTNDLGYVMKRLNQSDPGVTLRYIGLDRSSMDRISKNLTF